MAALIEREHLASSTRFPSFAVYWHLTITQPRTGFETLRADPRSLRFGFGATVPIGILSTITVAGVGVASLGAAFSFVLVFIR